MYELVQDDLRFIWHHSLISSFQAEHRLPGCATGASPVKSWALRGRVKGNLSLISLVSAPFQHSQHWACQATLFCLPGGHGGGRSRPGTCAQVAAGRWSWSATWNMLKHAETGSNSRHFESENSWGLRRGVLSLSASLPGGFWNTHHSALTIWMNTCTRVTTWP